MVKAGHGGDPLLRRPFSVFEILREKDRTVGLSLLSKRIGPTTQQLFGASEGDRIACLGPLGTRFLAVDPPVESWLVAGGVGLAPFATLAEALQDRGVQTTLFYGARTGAELFYLDWFSTRGVKLVLAAEDGSRGATGRVTEPLRAALTDRGRAVMLYACGPEPMLAAVAALADEFGVPSQVSVERVMGCGLGGCYSCVIPVKDGEGDAHYVRSCISGPVFDGATVVWPE